MPITSDYINELETRHGPSLEIDELRNRYAPDSSPISNTPEQEGKKATSVLDIASELELPIATIENIYDPAEPPKFTDEGKPYSPSFNIDFSFMQEVHDGIELQKQRDIFKVSLSGATVIPENKQQQQLTVPPEQTKWENIKKFFVGEPTDDDVARWTKKGRYEKFHDKLNFPMQIAMQYTIGRTLQVPQLAWATIKRLVPETAETEDVYDMNLTEAMGWAANYNPSGFTKLLGDIAEITGGAQTSAGIGDRLGVLVNGGKGADWGSKALRAEQIGAILGTSEKLVKGTASKIDTGTDYGEGGLEGVAGTIAGFGVFSMAGSAVDAGWKNLLKTNPKFGKKVDSYFKDRYQKQILEQAKEKDAEFKKTGKTPSLTSEQQARADEVRLTARKEILEAKKIFRETGDRAEWDKVRTYWGGIEEGKIAPSPSGDITVKDFGKYPIVKAKTMPLHPPVAPVTAKLAKTDPTAQPAKTKAPQGKVEENKPVINKKTGIINHKSGGFVDLTPLADAGIQVRSSLEATGKSLTRFTGLSSEVKQTLIEFEEEMKNIPYVARGLAIEKYGKLTPDQEKLIENYVELGQKTPEQFKDMPKELREAGDELLQVNEQVSQILKDIGFEADWPNNQIKALTEKLEKIGEKEVPDVEQEIAIQEAIDKLENVRWLHHTYSKLPFEKVKRVVQTFTGKITKKPSGMTGRKFATLGEAEELGFKRSPLAVSYADMTESVAKAVESDRLIKAINDNPNLSQWSETAPDGWVTIDDKIFPSSVSRSTFIEGGKPKVRTKRRKYPVPVAEALKELTYTYDPIGIVRIYDEINLVMKQVGFYNPFIMSKNDVGQLWRVTGTKGIVKLPQAVKIFFEKGDEYHKLRKGGLFNNAVNHTESARALTEHMLTTIRETSGEKVARIAGEHLKLQTWVNDLTMFNEKTTWNLDQMMRIATYKALENSKMMEGMTDFQKIEFANDAMVNYAKLPKATKKHLNRVIFTPSYRVGNFRFFWGQLAKHPWKFKGPILRTVGYKMFIKYGIPAFASAVVASKFLDDKEVSSEQGYKIVVYNPDTNTDTVYSLSDPLLEGAKITQRPFRQSLENNLSAILSTALRVYTGPKNKSTDDPIGEFFKLGTPIYRDMQLWKATDKTTAQKVLTQFAIAYVYHRQHKEPVNDTAVTALAKGLSVWTDWKMQAEDIRRMYKGKSAYFGPGGEFDRLLREYNLEQGEEEDAVDGQIEKLFRMGKDKDAIEFAMNSERYKSVEGISGRYLRSHAPLAYYWSEMSTTNKARFVSWLSDKGYDVNNLETGKLKDMEKAIEKQLINLSKSQSKFED